MFHLPLLALRLLFRKPQLFLLSIFPGIFTLILSGMLANQVRAIGGPLAMISAIAVFFISWIAIGNLALLPVEDMIIDQVQVCLWSKLTLPGRKLNASRIFGETFYGFLVALIGIIIFITEFIPGAFLVDFILSGLLLSYSFLSTIYRRKYASIEARVVIFFKDFLANLFLGIILSVLLFIPIVNVFLLGYAQVLATLFYFRKELANKDHT